MGLYSYLYFFLFTSVLAASQEFFEKYPPISRTNNNFNVFMCKMPFEVICDNIETMRKCGMTLECTMGNLKLQIQKRAVAGGNRCHWGPEYWCESVENARSCDAIEWCESNVWLKDILSKDDM